MNDWVRYFDDVDVGDELPPLAFALTVYRLVMAAGANRDFNPIHHNTEWARVTGAPEMYANTVFLQGMWERAVREFIGCAGTMRSMTGFRMRRFNTVGQTVVVSGRVVEAWREDAIGALRLEMRTADEHGITVGPGHVVVSMPLRST